MPVGPLLKDWRRPLPHRSARSQTDLLLYRDSHPFTKEDPEKSGEARVNQSRSTVGGWWPSRWPYLPSYTGFD
jgi:hypothetical protein